MTTTSLPLPAGARAPTALPVPTRRRVMVLSDAVPERNGVGTYYRDLADHLAARGIALDLIPAKTNCAFRQHGFSLRMPGDYTQRIHFPNIPRIDRWVRDARPDVLIAPTLGPFGFYAWALARRYRIRLVVGHHTAYDQLARCYWSGARAYVSSRCLENGSRLLMRAADEVIVNTGEMAREAERFGAKRVRCLGTTVAWRFLETPTAPPPRAVRSVLFAGRLAAEKNLGAVVAAAAAHPEVVFRFAGEGPMRPMLEAEAARRGNLELLGWLSRERLLAAMDACDLVVLPSHIESFGSVALEGMARARLVLVSARCGILDWPVLADGLFAQGEGEPLSGAIGRLAALPGDRLARTATEARRVTEGLCRSTIDQWVALCDEPAAARRG